MYFLLSGTDWLIVVDPLSLTSAKSGPMLHSIAEESSHSAW